eukprot:scaffold133314_cov94-Phaeocystis_antarctica.AAC.3
MAALPVYLEHDVRQHHVGVVVQRRPCGQLGDVVVDGELEQQQLLEAHLTTNRARGSGLGARGSGLGARGSGLGARAWCLGSGLGLEAKGAHLAVGIGVEHAEELGDLLCCVAHAQRVEDALELLYRHLARPLAPMRDQLEEARHVVREHVEDLRRHVDLVDKHLGLFILANPTDRDTLPPLLDAVPPAARLDAKPSAEEARGSNPRHRARGLSMVQRPRVRGLSVRLSVHQSLQGQGVGPAQTGATQTGDILQWRRRWRYRCYRWPGVNPDGDR